MSNMSYCRFRNTNMDLNDCYNAVAETAIAEDVPEEEAILEFIKEDGTDDSELVALKNLVGTCIDIANEWGPAFEGKSVDELREMRDKHFKDHE